jgi:hypothetical protein
MSNIFFREDKDNEFRLVAKFFNRLRNIFTVEPRKMQINYPAQLNDTLKVKKAVTTNSTLDVRGELKTVDITSSGNIVSSKDIRAVKLVATSDIEVAGDAVVTGKINATSTVDATDTIFNGWHGNKTRIKILFTDFLSDDDRASYAMIFDDDSGNTGLRALHSTAELWAFKSIPTGYKATHVMIYGSDVTNAITIYSGSISGQLGVNINIGSGYVGTEIQMRSPLVSTDTNYLAIDVATTATDDLLYGGYITIEKV